MLFSMLNKVLCGKFLLIFLLLMLFLSLNTNASSSNRTKYLDILVIDDHYPSDSITKSGFGFIACNETKIKNSDEKFYKKFKTESKTHKCDSMIDLISYVHNLEFKNKSLSDSLNNLTKEILQTKSSLQNKSIELESVMKDKLVIETKSSARIKELETVETESIARIKELENEMNIKNRNLSDLEKKIAHLQRLLKEETLKDVIIGTIENTGTNCTICTVVNENTISTVCSNHPILAAGFNSTVIFIIGISLCALGIIFILITAGYICRKRSKYRVQDKPKFESPKVESMYRSSNASSIFAKELDSAINLKSKSVNKDPGITLKIDEPDIPQISLPNSGRVSTTMESTENTGIS